MKKILAVSLLSIACSGTSCSKNKVPSNVPSNQPPEPTQEQSEPEENKPDEELPPVSVPVVQPEKWTWPLKANEGLRNDSEGQGWFGAPRGTRKHLGVDLKAPIGSSVLAVCPGYYISGDQRPYGIFARLVCNIPGSNFYVSIMYAHLSSVKEVSEITGVKAGYELGTVGKSGNASDPNMDSHLHIEMRVWPDEKLAQTDTHSLRDSGPEYDWSQFENALSKCTPLNFPPEIRQNHIFDPVRLLFCFGSLPPEINDSWVETYKGL